MTYDYIPRVPDYYRPPDDSIETNEYADYYADLEEKRKRENEDCRKD